MDIPPYDTAGEGPAVVFLHSFPLDRSMWAGQLAAAPQHGVRAIALDLPGFGTSVCPVGVPSLSVYADAVVALLDHLAIEQATVVGLSLGGYVALTLARHCPQRLAGLVLADTRAAADTPAVRAGRVVNLAVVRKHGTGAMLNRLIQGLIAPGTSTETKTHIHSIAGRQSAEAVGFALLAMRDRPDATPTLATLTVPTLVLVGEHDAVTPPAEMRTMASAIPGADFKVIPGAGHLSNLEQPAAFDACLWDFLATARTHQTLGGRDGI